MPELLLGGKLMHVWVRCVYLCLNPSVLDARGLLGILREDLDRGNTVLLGPELLRVQRPVRLEELLR